MTENIDYIDYIDKLIKLKVEISKYFDNRDIMRRRGYNKQQYFLIKYLPLRIAFNKLKTLDDNIYNFIIKLVYEIINHDNHIKLECKKDLLCIVNKYYI